MDITEVIEKISEYGISKLARKLNISAGRVGNWKQRKKIPPQFIRAVAKEIGVEVEEILKAIEKEKR